MKRGGNKVKEACAYLIGLGTMLVYAAITSASFTSGLTNLRSHGGLLPMRFSPFR